MDYRIQKSVTLAVMQLVLKVPAKSLNKLMTRLMLLNRLGFPIGVHAGRGYRGGYSLNQFWQLVLAFRLMRLGVGLSRIVEMVNESWDIAYIAIAHSLPGNTIPDLHFWWVIEPAGLEDFDLEKDPKPLGEEFAEARSIQTVAFEEGQSLQEFARDEHLVEFLSINAQQVVADVLAVLASPDFQIDQAELHSEMIRWAREPAERLNALYRRGS